MLSKRKAPAAFEATAQKNASFSSKKLALFMNGSDGRY